MATWFEGEVSVDGTAIHYYRTGGEKLPLILLHGFLDSGLCWTRMARDLEAYYDIVMIDARHHGRSGGFTEGFSYDVLANDVAAIVRVLELKPPVSLFGHSIGAMTALVFAATHPELTRVLVLEDPFLPGGALTSPETDQSIQSDLQALVALRGATPDERLIMAREANPGWDEEEIAPWAASKGEFDFNLLASIAGALTYPWRETLARVSCPLLVITADPQRRALITPERLQEMSQIWRAGEAVHVSDAGHSIHRDQYEATIRAAQAFLQRH